ncbi:MAG: glycosyltransferase family 39 protein [Sedimentisphaerales bacterium]|nr:glycosyltransferase family 39 protein [Sedimentisphaerales bacterium]
MKMPFDNQYLSKNKLLFLLIISICLLAFGFQGSRGIWQPDEGNYVGAAVTMLKNNNLLVPKISSEIFLEKPPMLYWQIIAGIKLLGRNEFACRFFNGLCFALTALLVSLLAGDIFKNKNYMLSAAFIYATMAIPFTASNFLTPDTTLTLWTTLSILFFYKSLSEEKSAPYFKILMCIALGLGFLTKGPAVLIPCAGIFVYLILTKQLKKFFLCPSFLIGAALFMTIGLSWYIYISLHVPGSAEYFFDNQLWGRLVSPKYRRNPEWFKSPMYIPILFAGAFPWLIIWPGYSEKMKAVLSKSWWKQLPRQNQKLFLAAMTLMPLLILSLASSRLPLYCLPLFPILAVIASYLWTDKISSLLQNIKTKPAAALLFPLWILTLLSSRFALGQIYETPKDARALWTEISSYIPNEEYEIVTLDKRADGLLFYGAMEVENVTRKDNPYPKFSMPETIESEILELIRDNHIYMFIIQKKNRFESTLQLLEAYFDNIKIVTLKHEKWLIIIEPENIETK